MKLLLSKANYKIVSKRLFTYFLPLTLLSLPLTFILPTKAQLGTCPEEDKYDNMPTSSTYKTIELPSFGINVDIPSNSRTMLLQNGAIKILHPADYALIQCVARGEGYGRGHY